MSKLEDRNYREQEILCCDNCIYSLWTDYYGGGGLCCGYDDKLKRKKHNTYIYGVTSCVETTGICDKYKKQ